MEESFVKALGVLLVLGTFYCFGHGIYLFIDRRRRIDAMEDTPPKKQKEVQEELPQFMGARVLAKKVGLRQVGSHQQPKSKPVYTLVFLTDQGEERQFKVSKTVFESCREQQVGTLVAAGDTFLSFGEGEELWDPATDLPQTIEVFAEGTGSHLQGIALDGKKEYLYCSFTTCLIKMDLQGNPVASVKGLAGHLGCIAYHPADGKIYGSLEYKHDKIGQGILENIGYTGEIKDGFYIVSFDPDKMTRMDMDAETDGVMSAVFLKEVYDDYATRHHAYGCSGIDGVTFAPAIGEEDEKLYLYVAYGIYGDTARTDNDHQVLLQYDVTDWKQYARPLSQGNMHCQGPDAPNNKYFVYTGNTNYGIQNLEYDPYSRSMLAAVYKGKKEQFENYSLFFIDCNTPAQHRRLKGTDGEKGELLRLAEFSNGSHFPYGATGLIALGDGYYYASEGYQKGKGYGGHICRYTWEELL